MIFALGNVHWPVSAYTLLASEAESSVITSSLSFTSDLQWPEQAALQSLCSFASDSSGCLFKAQSFSLWIASFSDCRTGHFSWVLSALEKYWLGTYFFIIYLHYMSQNYVYRLLSGIQAHRKHEIVNNCLLDNC